MDALRPSLAQLLLMLRPVKSSQPLLKKVQSLSAPDIQMSTGAPSAIERKRASLSLSMLARWRRSSMSVARNISGTDIVTRNNWSASTLSTGVLTANGPRPWTAPEIDRDATTRSDVLTPAGPNRTAAQRRNGRGRYTSSGNPALPRVRPLKTRTPIATDRDRSARLRSSARGRPFRTRCEPSPSRSRSGSPEPASGTRGPRKEATPASRTSSFRPTREGRDEGGDGRSQDHRNQDIGDQASKAGERADAVGEAAHPGGRDDDLEDAGKDEQAGREREARRTSLTTELKYAASV